MPQQAAQFLTLADNRKLCYQEYGDPQGHPVIHAHGAPSCRLEAATFDQAARERGLRIIATDRPGYGQSDYLPKRRWPDYVKDIEQLTAHLGIERFGHMGWSGGGPPTLAVARYIPERLDFAISLAGQPGILGSEDKKLLSKADQVAVSLLHTSPMLFRSFFRLMSAMEKVAPETFYDSFVKSAGQDDARILAMPANREAMMTIMKEAFLKGGKGVAWDAEIDYEDFGWRPEEITFPVHVFQGDQDNFVIHDLQKRYASHMPNAVWHELPGRGHFFPMEMQAEILDLAKELIG